MSWDRIAYLWSAVFAFDAARYLVGVGLVALVLYGLLRPFSESRRIQSRRPRSNDYRREILWSLSTSAVFATVGLATVVAYQTGIVEQHWRPERMGWGWTIASLPIVLVVHDAYFYWTHRAMHHRWLFRRFHRVHHRSHTPSAWAAYAFAPGEALVMAAFFPLVTWALPVSQATLFVFMAIMILRNGMGHSGIEFHPRRWIDSPLDLMTTTTHHDLHHQRVHGNYGLYFTWWDRWMGTELPEYRAAFARAAAGRSLDGAVASAGRPPVDRPRSAASGGASAG